MKDLLFCLFLFSIFTAGIYAQNCTSDTDCQGARGGRRSCCYSGLGLGSCYNNRSEVCAYCFGGNQTRNFSLCSIAQFSSDAQCCNGQCINPNVSECCSGSFNSSGFLNGSGSICSANETSRCCGNQCQDERTERCCGYRSPGGRIFRFTTPKNFTCCGNWSCNPTFQFCNGSGVNARCVNKTRNGTHSGDVCEDQACCTALAEPNTHTGHGYLQHDKSCGKKGGKHCAGKSGCKFCVKAPKVPSLFHQAKQLIVQDFFGGRPTCDF